MSPRVGDGLVRLDGRVRAGLVRQPERAVGLPAVIGVAGDLAGADLAELTRSASADRVVGEAAAAGITAALSGRFPDPMDVEGVSATMFVRALPAAAAGR